MTPDQPRYSHNPLRFLCEWRSFPWYEMVSYGFMFAAAVMFAFGIEHRYTDYVYLIIILSVLTLYCGFFAALIWNDITDKDIDAVVHPSRPIPSNRITSKRFFVIALLFSVLTFLFAFIISPWCFILVGVSALFVAVHNRYLKKIVKIPAYSEILTPVQWLTVPIFGFFVVWAVLPHTGNIFVTAPILGTLSIAYGDLVPLLLIVLFTYFADDSHDIVEGISDLEGDKRTGVKTYATSFGPRTAAVVSFIMVILAGIFGILLYFFSLLSEIFLIPFLAIWVYTLVFSYRLAKETDYKEQQSLGRMVGRKDYNFLLFSYVFIFVDILVQLVLALPRGC
jgi:4-hydroxybenzoate polyprenyltransferase